MRRLRRLVKLFQHAPTLIMIHIGVLLIETQDTTDAAHTILINVDIMTILISMQMKCAVYAVVVVLAAPAALELQYSDLQ